MNPFYFICIYHETFSAKICTEETNSMLSVRFVCILRFKALTVLWTPEVQIGERKLKMRDRQNRGTGGRVSFMLVHEDAVCLCSKL